MRVLLRGVVGSTAYGLNVPGRSDVDWLGMFAAPTEEFHGLRLPKDTYTTKDPDSTLHEAGKYAHLALGCNPTAIELMWLPEYEVRTDLGDDLIAIRGAFLSAKRVRDAYFGYATSQFGRLERRGDGTFSSDTQHRTAKHARHLLRLLFQGYHLYRYGTLMIRLEDSAVMAIREFGDRVAGGDTARAHQILANYEAAFDRYTSPLPDRPDEATVERWLLEVRRAHYTPAEAAA